MTTSPAEPPVRPSRFSRSARGLVVGHTGQTVAGYHATFVVGLLFPLAAGAAVFGWRAIATVAMVLASVFAGTLAWRRIGTRGHPLRPAQLLRLGLLLALMLPAKLAAGGPPWQAAWPLPLAAGLLLAVVCWLAGPGGGGRMHPVVFVFLALAALHPTVTGPRTVLQRNHLLSGDVLRVTAPAPDRAVPDKWSTRPPTDGDAVACPSPTAALLSFTRGTSTATSVDDLLRDRLPPLEDVVLGASPGPIGGTSAVAVIFGGLFLLYRGLIDFRVPLLIVVVAWVTIMVLPVPIGHGWRSLAGTAPAAGWAAVATVANYEVLASPLLFTAFFLAGSPSVRPLGRPARAAYAAFIGVATAVLQIYLSVGLGSYLAVLAAGPFASALDRWLSPRPLV